MKALVFEQPGHAAVLDLEVPTIAADEVLVRSRSVGICHSDFELYEGRYIIPVSYPIIPGHEWSGEVAEVGSAVTTLRQGDRVVGECVLGRGAPRACRLRRNRCGWQRPGRDRAHPVEGPPCARDNRLRRPMAADDSLHGDERSGSDAAADSDVSAG